MGSYIIRRIFQSLMVVLLVTVIIFFGMRLLPGDPIYMLINPNEVQSFTPEQLDEIRHQAGIDRPLVIQYFSWLGGVFQGELGQSVLTKTSASKEISRRIPVTAHLGILAFILGKKGEVEQPVYWFENMGLAQPRSAFLASEGYQAALQKEPWMALFDKSYQMFDTNYLQHSYDLAGAALDRAIDRVIYDGMSAQDTADLLQRELQRLQ